MPSSLHHDRRDFLKQLAAGGMALGLPQWGHAAGWRVEPGKRVGIIGLDTSHSAAFTRVLNAPDAGAAYKGYRVTAAYPYGSRTIDSSAKRIPGYVSDVKQLNVAITDSIAELLKQVDVVLLETNDGRLHREQALAVLKTGKRLFIDKPMAASLTDVVAIFDAADAAALPIFSSSSLRYLTGVDSVDKKQVLGADTFSPAVLEKTHPDLFWYGIHGVETLYAVMGTGCREVVRAHTDSTDVVTGTWADGRIGTFRGTRTGKNEYGGTVYTQTGTLKLGPYGGYEPLLKEIISYFETGVVPVQPGETIELFTFMEAADESRRRGGIPVALETVQKTLKK